MFNKLKQIRDLRNKAKTLQNVLSEIKVEAESNGIKIIMDGNQKIMAEKMQSMGGLDNFKI